MPDINITLDNSDKVVNVTLEQEEPVVNVEVVSSGPAGAPGYTPVKGVDYFDGYTPVKGVDYFDGYTPVKGVDYFDGQDGADGVSPEVSIGVITGGHSVTITDADHPGGQTFNVMDGQDGEDGAPGQDGADGAPGVGVPTGGTTGQVLAKASSTDYDTEWVNAGGGSTEIFWAVKDTTTSAEIEAAYQAGYLVCLSYNSRTYTMVYRQSSTKHHFCNAYNNSIWLIVCDNDTWSSASSNSIPSASDTNPQNLGSKSAGTSTRWARGDHVHEMPYWMGRATCSTAEATAAKTASISNYVLKTGNIVSIRFENAVPASATLNISSTGTHAIYYKNSAIPAGIIKAGDTATFIYSTYYHLISIDRQPSKSDVGLGNVDNIQQYSANNPPPYPVTSVNNQTGAVSLSIPSTASDVGAVAVAQGVAHAGEFVVVGSDGNITTVTMATWQGGSY